jgi:hypothetical protein
MTEDASYNGWSNRETWLAGLWLDNDEYFNRLLLEACRLNMADYEQAEWLEKHLRDSLDDEASDASFWSDLLSTAFSRINWVEVIENSQ